MTETETVPAATLARMERMREALRELVKACGRLDEDENGSTLVMAIYSSAMDKARAALEDTK